ncbi:RNB domain-containing ribonuclease [Streptomyces sp. NPDC048638]|uniref:RNB domain-containing ribonuclease n=1 Tax=Streptomyces sp. NPDC048638 TaxID=3365580 RepID=UPI00372183E3
MPAHVSPAPSPAADSRPVPLMIDRKGSVDRDDAITVAPFDGGWILTVYVADVASGVAPASAADREAFKRRESAYGGFRGTAKMLPRPVEDRLTLAEGRTCATLRVQVTFDRAGAVLDVQVDRAQLHGALAMDHHEVAAAVADPAHRLHHQLCDAAELSEVLLARRRSQGALALYDLMKGWATDEDGRLVRLAAAERNVAYKIVQECMIAANTAVAGWAAERDLVLLFRNHSAAKVAPPRAEFLDDLDLALSDGSGARLQALQERTLLVMRPAEYAPFMRGHWGLNLPGYVHATSPLRRYADLVVQRVIFSHIDGRPSPYADCELQAVAESLTAGARADREAQMAVFKSAAHSRARRAASSEGDYTRLDTREFHALLKRACKENIDSSSLIKEAVRRAEQQQLTSLELQMVLLVTTSDAWEAARAGCLSAIVAAPETAVSVLTTHAQINALPNPVFSDESSGSAHSAAFRSRAEFRGSGGPVVGEVRAASSKKAARHQAAVSLLARLAGLPDPSRDQLPAAGGPSAAPGKAASPTPAAASREDDSCPPLAVREFHALLKRGCKEGIASDSLIKESVRRAEQQQLTSLELQMILFLASGETWQAARVGCLQAIAAAPEMAVSVLTTHAQTSAVANPAFTESSSGPTHDAEFRSRAELTVGGGPVYGEERTASVKKSARHQAALSLLARLAGLPDPSRDQLRADGGATARPAKVPSATAAEGRQPVMVLNEYVQSLVISDLRFDFTMAGPGHQTTFTCTAHALHEGDPLRGAGKATGKSASKAAAAENLLQQIHARLHTRESDAA